MFNTLICFPGCTCENEFSSVILEKAVVCLLACFQFTAINSSQKNDLILYRSLWKYSFTGKKSSAFKSVKYGVV